MGFKTLVTLGDTVLLSLFIAIHYITTYCCMKNPLKSL